MICVNASTHGPEGSQSSDYGPQHKAFWVLLSAFLAYAVGGVLLYVYALALAVAGALLATWTAVALQRRAARRGRRVLLAPLWIVPAGISPAILPWLILLPRIDIG